MSLLAGSEYDAAFGEVVRGQLNGDFVARQDADVIFAHLAGDVSGNFVIVFEFDSESGVWQGFDDRALHFNAVFFGHIASRVIKTRQ